MALLDVGWLAFALALAILRDVVWVPLALLAGVFTVLMLPYSVALGACIAKVIRKL